MPFLDCGCVHAETHMRAMPNRNEIIAFFSRVSSNGTLQRRRVDEKNLNKRRVEISFDVTDPKRPVWKFWIGSASLDVRDVPDNYEDQELAGFEGANLMPFRIIIDSKTGEVLQTIRITYEMTTSDYRF